MCWAPGETVEVPLAITGAGVEAGDVKVAQPSDGRAGVSVRDGETPAPVVVLTGSGQRGVQVDAAELTVTAGDDADSVHEYVTIGPGEWGEERAWWWCGGRRGRRQRVGLGGGCRVVDDDAAAAAAVLASPWSVSLVEGPRAGMPRRRCRCGSPVPPTGTVTVSVRSADGLAVRVAPLTLEFTASDWDDPQTLTLTAADDTDTLAETGVRDVDRHRRVRAVGLHGDGRTWADSVSEASSQVGAVFRCTAERSEPGPRTPTARPRRSRWGRR